jgi:hypothetical protein
VYTLLPRNVRLIERSEYVCVDVKSRAALNAFTKSMYALVEDVVPGATTLPPTVVPAEELKPVIVPDPLITPILPVMTEVPVFEIVPPSIVKSIALLRSTRIGAPKAGTTAARVTTTQFNLALIFPPFAPRSFSG